MQIFTEPHLDAMSASPTKTRHLEERTDEPVYKLDDEDDNYVPYVPVKQRKQQRLQQLASRGGAEGNSQEEKPKKDDQEEKEDEELEEMKRREKTRKERTLLLEAQEVKAKKALEGQCPRPQLYLSDFLQMQARLTRRRPKRRRANCWRQLPADGSSHLIWNWRRAYNTQSQ
jgi:hypothetical protein